jgi:hypothetical protein
MKKKWPYLLKKMNDFLIWSLAARKRGQSAVDFEMISSRKIKKSDNSIESYSHWETRRNDGNRTMKN